MYTTLYAHELTSVAVLDGFLVSSGRSHNQKRRRRGDLETRRISKGLIRDLVNGKNQLESRADGKSLGLRSNLCFY